MTRLSFIPVLLVAALACSDTPVGPYPVGTYPVGMPEEEDGFEMVNGTVLSTSEMLANDGRIRRLIGPQAALLRDLIGAEIRVRGTADEFASTELWIVEFRVLTVDGLPALDGILHPAPDGGFELSSADGDLTLIGEIPGELMDHFGKRVWLTMRGGNWVRFGLLEE